MIKNTNTFCLLGAIATISALSFTAFATVASATDRSPIQEIQSRASASEKAVGKVVEITTNVAEKKSSTTIVAENANDAKAEDKPARKKPEFEDGKYIDADENPTYYYDPETKKWDWYSYAGNRTYHAECHVCHGPFANGSSFAPVLADSLKDMSYEKFQETVINGQKNVWGRTNSIMPAFGVNKGVYCRLDDLYVYLKARASGDLPAIPTRSMKKVGPSKEYREYVSDCLGDE